MNHSITPPEAEGTPAGNGVARRTLLAGAAWTVPVIAVATATPAAAASAPLIDLRITNFGNGPQDGRVSYWDTPNGEPGYYHNKPLLQDITVQNAGPGTATQFTLEVQIDAGSYKNGTLQIGNGSDPRWSITNVRPTANTTVTFTFNYSGSLAAGESTRLIPHFATSDQISGERHVVPLAAIIQSAEPESDTNNNITQSSPSYWVKQL